MEAYIQISKINDFIFCPHSLYLHTIYDEFSTASYQDVPQTKGKLKHQHIDDGTYSTLKEWLQGTSVYSAKYNIAGKIDLYNKKTFTLVERKYKIKTIYDGYVYQLYAQYFALQEQGYPVHQMYLHSLSDNKRYQVALPTPDEILNFEKIINAILIYDNAKSPEVAASKCLSCIYSSLCEYAELT